MQALSPLLNFPVYTTWEWAGERLEMCNVRANLKSKKLLKSEWFSQLERSLPCPNAGNCPILRDWLSFRARNKGKRDLGMEGRSRPAGQSRR